ncbi:MAG: ATP-binding protein [Planctomycetes bacterium]|nr:ATP-binding protein [Planctomycetota bacterium]
MNELVSEILRFSGFEPVRALTGEEALNHCREDLPAAMLLDIMLPGISGYEVCRRMKAARRTNLVPVVMLTALDRRDDHIHGIRVGADEYVTKPFDPETLVAALRRTIDHVHERLAGGLQGHIELKFQSDIRYLEEVNALLLGLYAHSPLSEEDIQQIRYCLIELGRNAIEWGCRDNPDLTVQMEYTMTDRDLTFVIRDQGPGFDPSHLPHAADGQDAVAHTTVREQMGLREGGFGILLSRKFMDEVRYNATGNEVTVVKRFPAQAS